MLNRILVVLSLSCSLAFAAEPGSPTAPASAPSEASIKQLLEAANAHKLVDEMMRQVDGLFRQAMLQATQGHPFRRGRKKTSTVFTTN